MSLKEEINRDIAIYDTHKMMSCLSPNELVDGIRQYVIQYRGVNKARDVSDEVAQIMSKVFNGLAIKKWTLG